MAILTNRLQYLAKKNKKFMSRGSSHKSSRKEDQKGCFNCKKIGHFIAECPDLQKEKSKEKSKKQIFKSNKFKKQFKKSLMATWEDQKLFHQRLKSVDKVLCTKCTTTKFAHVSATTIFSLCLLYKTRITTIFADIVPFFIKYCLVNTSDCISSIQNSFQFFVIV